MNPTALIDVHCHINFLEQSPEEAVKLATDAGVERLITIGTCPDDHPVVLKLVEQFQDNVFGTLGVHPHDAKTYSDAVDAYLRQNLLHPKIVAVGEMGLDYYYDNSPREEQRDAFRRQLDIAAELKLPIEVHTRDAEDDTIAILEEYRGKVNGLIHCFTGTQRLANACLDLGYNISISGVVTFKKADELRAVCKSIPLDRLHVETDAPFLAPVPMRGQKNRPDFVVHTAKFVADLHGVSVEELAVQTKANALALFKKLNW